MGLAAHIDVTAHEHVLGVFGMERIDLRVLGLGEIEDVVTLHGLVEEGQAQGEDDQRDELDSSRAAEAKAPIPSSSANETMPPTIARPSIHAGVPLNPRANP